VSRVSLTPVARKKEVARMFETVKVKAVLTQTVQYNKDGKDIQHCIGTTIEVDPEQGIALCKGDHFDIESTEYKVMYLN
jgi:hypothetical protein